MVEDVKRLEIKVLQLMAGIWQYEFAARFGIPANSSSQIESGGVNLRRNCWNVSFE